MSSAVYYAGIDWARAEHVLCVIDACGVDRTQVLITPSAEGLDEMRRVLAQFGDPAGLPVAVSRPFAPLVEALLDFGNPVIVVHHFTLKAVRRTWGLSCHDSARDAYILANLIRTRPRCARLQGWPAASSSG